MPSREQNQVGTLPDGLSWSIRGIPRDRGLCVGMCASRLAHIFPGRLCGNAQFDLAIAISFDDRPDPPRLRILGVEQEDAGSRPRGTAARNPWSGATGPASCVPRSRTPPRRPPSPDCGSGRPGPRAPAFGRVRLPGHPCVDAGQVERGIDARWRRAPRPGRARSGRPAGRRCGGPEPRTASCDRP